MELRAGLIQDTRNGSMVKANAYTNKPSALRTAFTNTFRECGTGSSWQTCMIAL